MTILGDDWLRSLLAVHLLASAPLALQTARLIVGRRSVPYFAVAFACGMSLILGRMLNQSVAGDSATGFALRSAFALSVATGVFLLVTARTRLRTFPRPTAFAIGAATAAAILLPAAYQQRAVQQQLAQAEDFYSQGRYLRFLESCGPIRGKLDGLEIAGRSARGAYRYADAVVEENRRRTARPLADSSTAAERIDYARRLATLDEFDRAEAVLQAADDQCEACFVLGAVLQKGSRFEESIRCYEKGLRLAETEFEAPLPQRVRAINAIAFNLRELRRYQEAERLYLNAIDDCPDARGFFELQLGRHYMLGGRVWEARDRLQAAAKDPSVQVRGEAASLLDELRRQTPACVLPFSR